MGTHEIPQHVHARWHVHNGSLPLLILGSQAEGGLELGCLGLFLGQATSFPHWLQDPILAALSKLCLAPEAEVVAGGGYTFLWILAL